MRETYKDLCFIFLVGVVIYGILLFIGGMFDIPSNYKRGFVPIAVISAVLIKRALYDGEN